LPLPRGGNANDKLETLVDSFLELLGRHAEVATTFIDDSDAARRRKAKSPTSFGETGPFRDAVASR
jgi:hypothetical protein